MSHVGLSQTAARDEGAPALMKRRTVSTQVRHHRAQYQGNSAIICGGDRNIPDGSFQLPVKISVEGM